MVWSGSALREARHSRRRVGGGGCLSLMWRSVQPESAVKGAACLAKAELCGGEEDTACELAGFGAEFLGLPGAETEGAAADFNMYVFFVFYFLRF